MKVLIAEDDPHTRAGLEEILEAEGYQVFAAKDGKDAKEEKKRGEGDRARRHAGPAETG